MSDPGASGLTAREPGFTLITATQRLSSRLIAAWDRREVARSRAAWCAPDILPWNAWVQRGMATLDDARMGLSAGQERAIWEDIVGHSTVGNELLHGPSVAAIAQSAWKRMHDWSLERAQLEADASEDVRAFLQWSEEFAARTRRGGWLDEARMLPLLAEAVRARRARFPARLLLGGFDELSPAQKGLCADIVAAGSRVRAWWPRSRPGRTVRSDFRSTEEEFRAAASWAREHLRRDPRARLAIVVPDLAGQRSLLERVLVEVLDPPALDPGVAPHPGPFNFSLGRPLADYASVDCALRMLDAVCGALPVDDAGVLLRSPYVGGGQAEWSARAALDARIRRRGEPLVDTTALRAMAQAENCTVLSTRLEAVNALAPAWRQSRRRSAAQWAADVASVLAAFGWPGDRTLDSVDYQVQEAWRALLGRLAQLEPVTGPFDARRVVDILRREARETVFQPRTGDAPVQVLGVIEAAGLAFDALWVTGLDAGSWPQAPQPNPLLPLGLQRRLGMPHASSERELAYARLVLDRLARSAGEVMLSHPRTIEDRDLQPSPLLAGISIAENRRTTFHGWRETLAANRTVVFESIDVAPPFPDGQVVPGGSAVFTHQSACPFRAFAMHRLGATPIEEVRPGLDAATRGTLVHDVLEAFWRDVRSHATLAGLSAEQRKARLLGAIDSVLARWTRKRPATFTPTFCALERSRLEHLITEWLLVELDRQPFTVVEPEGARQVSVEGLVLDLRIDRIDQIDAAGRMVIDYKTGVAKVDDWSGERPRQPQLPLYSVCSSGDPTMHAVAFGRVARRTCGFAGYADRAGLAAGVEPAGKEGDPQVAWAQLLAGWREVIGRLAREFRAGHASVDPRDEDSCRYCALPPLCRVRELDARLGRLGEGDHGDE